MNATYFDKLGLSSALVMANKAVKLHNLRQDSMKLKIKNKCRREILSLISQEGKMNPSLLILYQQFQCKM